MLALWIFAYISGIFPFTPSSPSFPSLTHILIGLQSRDLEDTTDPATFSSAPSIQLRITFHRSVGCDCNSYILRSCPISATPMEVKIRVASSKHAGIFACPRHVHVNGCADFVPSDITGWS